MGIPSSFGEIDAASMNNAKTPVRTRPVQSIAGVVITVSR
jgi:hypothetical protein